MLGRFQLGHQLFRLEIPPSVRTINRKAFSNCSSFREILFPADSRISSQQENSPELCRLEIPVSVQIISKKALSYCSSLKEIPAIHFMDWCL
jgi:hypothetical protein